MKIRQLGILVAVLLVTLIGVDAWCFQTMADAKDQALQANEDASLCQRLSAQIIASTHKREVIGSSSARHTDLPLEVETASRAAGIDETKLASIDPDPPIRAGDSAYVEQPTTIQLRAITLGQLVQMMRQLTAGDSGLQVKSLRLSAPPEQNGGALWAAQVTVSSVTYSPLVTQPMTDRSR